MDRTQPVPIEPDPEEHLLKLEEAAALLSIQAEELRQLAEKGVVPARRIAGSFLRFEERDILSHRDKIESALAGLRQGRAHRIPIAEERPTFAERLLDFIQFNDFYLISLGIVLIILILLFKSK